jgi:hypothetical protein
VQTLKQGHDVSFTVDTDGRSGGCLQRFRLHRPLP